MSDATRRKLRDKRALERLAAGMPVVEVAARAGISTVQLWRRVGKPLKALKAAGLAGRYATAVPA